MTTNYAGHWTPTLINSEGDSIPINIMLAKYGKVDRVVICLFDIKVEGFIQQSTDTRIFLSGLPYIAAVDIMFSGWLNGKCIRDVEVIPRSIHGTILDNTVTSEIWISELCGGKRQLTESGLTGNTELVGTVSYLSI